MDEIKTELSTIKTSFLQKLKKDIDIIDNKYKLKLEEIKKNVHNPRKHDNENPTINQDSKGHISRAEFIHTKTIAGRRYM